MLLEALRTDLYEAHLDLDVRYTYLTDNKESNRSKESKNTP